MPGACDDEALRAAMDGMERGLALARVAVEYGDCDTARADVVRTVEHLAPELDELRAQVRRASVPRHHRIAEYLLAALLPAPVLLSQILSVEMRNIPYFPHLASTIVVAMTLGWKPALVTTLVTTAAGLYVIWLPGGVVDAPIMRGAMYLFVSLLASYAICRPRFRAPRTLEGDHPSRSAATPVP